MWMPGVLQSPTTAQGGYGIPNEGMRPDAVIMHTIEGWQSTMMSPSWTSNSYHFTIRQDGRKVQHVSIRTPAWHAGRVDSTPPTWKLWRPGVNPNTHTIGIAAEGRAGDSPTHLPAAWTVQQISSAIEILQWIHTVTGIQYTVDTLLGHSEVAVLSRSDPGPRWPKANVLNVLNPRPAFTVEHATQLYVYAMAIANGAAPWQYGAGRYTNIEYVSEDANSIRYNVTVTKGV
jgi:N-acetyl-anhydromuramyl-L-alanine amidase AmpD